MSGKTTVVHVTHEAVSKVGGIGAVLEGFFTSNAYNQAIDRNILVSPLFNMDGPCSDRLGTNAEIFYSSIDGVFNTNYVASFRKIEEYFGVRIVYGRRVFYDPHTGVSSMPEVILVDVTRMNAEPINRFKRNLFEQFGIRSHLHEHLWEYEQYIRLAPPAIAVLKAIGAADKENSTIVISHEFMGMPTVLAAILDNTYDFKTLFYAHEVATIRRIVEEHPGHDTMFYNVMKDAEKEGLSVSEVFQDQSGYFKHVLVEASKYCDGILAVGDYVAKELRFLAPEFCDVDIDLAYNGIPACRINTEEKFAARDRLRQYCENLLGYKPDFVFTHVTRLVKSKGLWRDIKVLEQLEQQFQKQNRTAVMFVLSTETCRRPTNDILSMETHYHWPVAHREGWPDLSGGEASFYAGVQEFNAKSKNIKVIFINQFGFNRDCCGHRMPEDIQFMDIRKGSDVEFGLSIYEPFGIAQLEPLSFGGICVVSNVCGCAGFVRDITGGNPVKNVIIADYISLNGNQNPEGNPYEDIEDMLQIDNGTRNQLEGIISQKLAQQISVTLPETREQMEQMLVGGYELARHMSWEVVVENYILKSFHKAILKQNPQDAYMRLNSPAIN